MATITLTGDRLRVALTTAEELAGLHGHVDVPLSAVRDGRSADELLLSVPDAERVAADLRDRTGTA